MGWNLKHRPIRVSNGPGGGATLGNLLHAALTGVGAGDKVVSVSYSGVNSDTVRTTATQVKELGKKKFFSLFVNIKDDCSVEV